LADIAARLGTSQTLDQAGDSLQEAARDWVNNVAPAKHAAAWAPVDALIPKDTVTPLTGFQGTLAKMTSSGGDLQPVLDALRPRLPKKLANALETSLDLGGTPTWSGAQQIRSAIGDAMTNPKITKDITQQQLSALYSSLTGDMRSAAGSISPDAATAFDSANAESTRLFGIQKGPMAKIITSGNEADEKIAPGTAAQRLLTQGRTTGDTLATLRQEIPAGVDELAAFQLGKAAPSWQRTSPEAQAALVPNQRDRDLVSSLTAKPASTPAQHPQLNIIAGGELGNLAGQLATHAGYPGLQEGLAAAGALTGAAMPLARRVPGALAATPKVVPSLLGANSVRINPLGP